MGIGGRLPATAAAAAESLSDPAGRAVAVLLGGAGVGLRMLARPGAMIRKSLDAEVARRLDRLVPEVLALFLRRVRLTEVIRENVDLDELVATVDIESAIARVDLDRVVQLVDLNAAAGRLDVDAIVERVDVDAVVQRLDVDAMLDRIDLTDTVLRRVDLDVVVAEVLSRVDLVKLAEQVIDGVDLPELIRESTGTLASDRVREARMQGIAADQAVGRAVDRLLLRRDRGRYARPPIPAQPDKGASR